jgi:hypothetical protein
VINNPFVLGLEQACLYLVYASLPGLLGVGLIILNAIGEALFALGMRFLDAEDWLLPTTPSSSGRAVGDLDPMSASVINPASVSRFEPSRECSLYSVRNIGP